MVKLPRPACLPDSGYVHSQDPEEEDWPEGPFLACAHLGPLGRVCCCRHPHRLGSRSPLTLAAPGGPWRTHGLRTSPHTGSREWARLPRLAPKSRLLAVAGQEGWGRGRRDGEGADGHGSEVPSTLHTPLGARNNSRSKKGRKQPLSSQGAASGPEVGGLSPEGNEFPSGGVCDDSRQVQADLRCQRFSSSGGSRLHIVLCLRPVDKEAFHLYTSLPSWEKAPRAINFRGAWSRPVCREWRWLISAL